MRRRLAYFVAFGLVVELWTGQSLFSSVQAQDTSSHDDRLAEESRLEVDDSLRDELLLTLPPLSSQEIAITEEPPDGSGPFRVGFHRETPSSQRQILSSDLVWHVTPNSRVAYIEIESPGAKSIRARLDWTVPKNSEVHYYGRNHKGEEGILHTVVPAVSPRENDPDRWTPIANGERLGIELKIPLGADPRSVRIELVRVSHGYIDTSDPDSFVLNTICSNHVRIACAIDSGSLTQSDADSTVRLRYEKEGSRYGCSGVLVETTDRSHTGPPYILTAAHCISTDTVASTVDVTWFYQRKDCVGAAFDSRWTVTSGGAKVVVASTAEDTTLLQLNNSAVSGATYSSWDATHGVPASTALYGVHHPNGDLKRFWSGESKGSINAIVCVQGQNCERLSDGIANSFSNGTIESGSSGAGVYLESTGDLVGIFSAARGQCTNVEGFIGRFSNFYPKARQWLDPIPPVSVPDDHGDTSASASTVLVNSSIDGEIEVVGDRDTFYIKVESSGQLSTYTVGSTDTEGRLYNTDRSIHIENDDGGVAQNFKITAEVDSGDYYVDVSGYQSKIGPYTLHVDFDRSDDSGNPDDHGNSNSTATDVNLNTGVSGTIDPTGDIDVFRVDIRSEGDLTVYTTGNLDTTGRLVSSDSTLDIDGDDEGSGGNFRITSTVVVGTYFVEVEGANGDTGSYQLHVEFESNVNADDHGDSRTDSTDVDVNTDVIGTIGAEDDVDVFRIEIESSGELAVYTTGSLDTEGRLSNAANTITRRDDDSGSDLNFRIETDVTAGTYYVEVSSQGSETGQYRLHVEFESDDESNEDDHGDTTGEATLVSAGTSVSGRLETAGDTDVFRVEIESTGDITVYTTGSTDTTGRLFSLDRTTDVSDDDGGSGTNFRIETDISEGTYYVEVDGYDNAVGEYTLHIEFEEAEQDGGDDHGDSRTAATDVDVDTDVAGTIGAEDDVDVFRIEVESSGELTVYTTGSLDTEGRLSNATNSITRRDDDSGTGLNFRIETDVTAGTYYVEVSSNGSATGQYRLHVEFEGEVGTDDDDHGDTTGDATVVSAGTSVSGRLETAGDTDVFRVEIASTGEIAAYTTGSTDTTGRLYSLDRTTDVSDDDGGRGTNFRIETDVAAGTYYVEVAGYDNALGEYTLHIELEEDSLVDGDDHGDSKATATATVVNSTIGGMIEEQGDRDYFTFDLSTTGELIVFTTGRLDTFGRLTSADGDVRKSNDDGGEGTNFRIEVDAHASTYHVEVRGFGLSTGSYRLHIEFDPDETTVIPDGITLSASAESVTEHDRSTATVTATLESPLDIGLLVQLESSGTATMGADFELQPTNIIVPVGETTGQTSLVPLRDWVREGDETADLQIVSGEGEDGQSARSISIQIEDDFDGSGQVIEPRYGFDLTPSVELSGGRTTVSAHTTVRNLGSRDSPAGTLTLFLYQHPNVHSGHEIEQYTVDIPALQALGGAANSTVEISLGQLARGTTFIGLAELATASTQELRDTNNSVYFGFTLDEAGLVLTECDHPARAAALDAVDPLTAFQWHLENTDEQNADLKISRTRKAGYSGQGVRVSIVDSGLEICHPDLQANIEANASVNVLADSQAANQLHSTVSHDPYNPDPTGDHGTSVAGIVAAVDNNGRGGRGVAPGAVLRGVNYLKSQSHDTLVTSLGGQDETTNDLDIAVLSFSELFMDDYDADTHDLFAWATDRLRSEKGLSIVKAGGNDFLSCSGVTHAIHDEIGCTGSNVDYINSIPFPIVVGAFNAQYRRSQYSSAGSNLWISAPGGEAGSADGGLVSTDQLGMDRGFGTVRTDRLWSRDDVNPDRDYTGVFNGTEGAAAAIAGAVAVLLEVEPDLTFRDVKHILARTARSIDGDRPATRISVGGVPHVLQSGWTTNAAGYSYHNWFGFGAVDVDAAVDLAEEYEPDSLGVFAVSQWLSNSSDSRLPIPDSSGEGLSDTLEVAYPIAYLLCSGGDPVAHCVDEGTRVHGPGQGSSGEPIEEADVNIEAVQIRLRIAHPRMSDLGIQITSPRGTTSIVNAALNNAVARSADEDDQFYFLSNAFYGESPVGTWRLKVVDVAEQETGEVISWEMKFYVGQHPEEHD